MSRRKRLARLVEEAAGRRWRITATSFFQARPDGVDALAAQVVRAVDDAPVPLAAAVDLFAGVGVFAGVLADLGLSVVAVEGAASAADDAAENLADDDVRVFRGDATRWRGGQADLVVADPSRAGLGSRGVEAVVSARPSRVVLISCDPAALGRDVRLLVDRGYAVRRVTPVDLFPHTTHVETVTVLDGPERD